MPMIASACATAASSSMRERSTISTSRSSDSTSFSVVSASISWRILWRTLSAECASPPSVAWIAEVKKNFATLCGWMDGVGKGQQLVMTYLPGQGTRVEVHLRPDGGVLGQLSVGVLRAECVLVGPVEQQRARHDDRAGAQRLLASTADRPGPDVRFALGGADYTLPLGAAGRDVEKALHAGETDAGSLNEAL